MTQCRAPSLVLSSRAMPRVGLPCSAELLNKQFEGVRAELEAERKTSAQLKEDLAKTREETAAELASERSRVSEAQQLAATLSGRLEATHDQ